MKINRRIPMALLSAIALLATVQQASAESPGQDEYNAGVDAWRKQDFSSARAHWTTALTLGGPDEAYNNLGFLLYYGQGGDAEPARALALWRKGAALSVSEAQLHLGDAYAEGTALPVDLVQAHAWYLCAQATARKATDQTDTENKILDEAIASANQLLPRLSLKEQAAAKHLAKVLIARYSQKLELPGIDELE